MTAPLPACSGPDGPCPSCGLPGAMTECHQAGPPGTAARPPRAGWPILTLPDGRGERLCRVCPNCGHAWAEACVGRTAPRPAPLETSSAGAGLLALAAGLAATAAGTLLSRVLGGAELLASWLAVIIAIAALTAAAHAAITARAAGDGPR